MPIYMLLPPPIFQHVFSWFRSLNMIRFRVRLHWLHTTELIIKLRYLSHYFVSEYIGLNVSNLIIQSHGKIIDNVPY